MTPKKTTTNQRRYSHPDIYRIAIVQLLLHTRGKSITEARAQLETLNMTDKGVEQQLSLLNEDDDDGAQTKEATPSPAQSPRDRVQPSTSNARKDSGSSFLAERERLNAEVARLRAQLAQLREEQKGATAKLALYSTALAKIRKTSLKGVENLVRILDEKS